MKRLDLKRAKEEGAIYTNNGGQEQNVKVIADEVDIAGTVPIYHPIEGEYFLANERQLRNHPKEHTIYIYFDNDDERFFIWPCTMFGDAYTFIKTITVTEQEIEQAIEREKGE